MSALALGGWILAGIALLLASHAHRRVAVRAEAVARASHELRGPLTSVRLALSLSARAGLSRSHQEALESELARAALALDDLDQARSGVRGTLMGSVERVSLRDLLQDAVIAAQGRGLRAAVEVTGRWSGADAIVWGDRVRLAQALANLVANAIEHGDGAVRVLGARRSGRAQLVVDDEGAGLPAAVTVLARRPHGGRGRRGRGLAIALEIARAHGGTVAAAPVGRGGRVVLELPAAATGRLDA